MERVGQKRRDNGDEDDEVAARLMRRMRDEEVDAISEYEIEEFFAILRRMRDAARCGVPGGGGGGKGTVIGDKEGMGRWRLDFKLEDFEEALVGGNEASSNTRVGPEDGKTAAEDGILRCIDLNVAPETEEPAGIGDRTASAVQ